jgi:hypothetical protein
MCVSRSRAVLRCLTALAFGAVALTGCGGGGGQADATTPGTSTTSSTSADETVPTTAPGGGTESDDRSAPNSAAPWTGTKQFVQIDDAWTSDGQTYLSVRPAQKEAVTQPYEAWVVVPGEGPYTTVPMAEDARVLLSVPLGDAKHAASYSQAELVSRLTAQPSSARSGLGYDLSFDGEGQVTRLQSLYTS